MKRISQKMLNEFIEKIAYLKYSNKVDALCYYSKIDGAYFTHKGMERQGFKFLLKRGITEQLQNLNNDSNCTVDIGFNPIEQKWYGWSHRALYGFGIGSTCKKGDCHYTADNPEEMIEDYGNFFADISEECALSHKDECLILSDRSGILINHSGFKIPTVNNMDELEKAINGEIKLAEKDVLSGLEIKKCGRGEWIAKSLKDAKQMTKDFAEGVS